MKILVVEDDFASRLALQKLMTRFGEVHVAVNGKEAMVAYQAGQDERQPYDLICLDIMLPEMDGQEVLKEIRAIEASQRIAKRTRIIMTTALDNKENVIAAGPLCDAYIVKPINHKILFDRLKKLGLID